MEVRVRLVAGGYTTNLFSKYKKKNNWLFEFVVQRESLQHYQLLIPNWEKAKEVILPFIQRMPCGGAVVVTGYCMGAYYETEQRFRDRYVETKKDYFKRIKPNEPDTPIRLKESSSVFVVCNRLVVKHRDD